MTYMYHNFFKHSTLDGHLDFKFDLHRIQCTSNNGSSNDNKLIKYLSCDKCSFGHHICIQLFSIYSLSNTQSAVYKFLHKPWGLEDLYTESQAYYFRCQRVCRPLQSETLIFVHRKNINNTNLAFNILNSQKQSKRVNGPFAPFSPELVSFMFFTWDLAQTKLISDVCVSIVLLHELWSPFRCFTPGYHVSVDLNINTLNESSRNGTFFVIAWLEARIKNRIPPAPLFSLIRQKQSIS